MNTYLIQNLYDPNLYWNPQKGWVVRDKAHGFDWETRQTFILPDLGCWVLVSQPASFDKKARFKERERKSELWDYYADFVRANGYESITQVVTLANKREQVIKQLVEALSGLGWHSPNHVDICWCHVKSDSYARHTEQCRAARAAIAAAEPYINPKSEGRVT